VLQCVAVCCSVLQCVAVCRHTEPEPSSAVCCSVLVGCVAVCCSVLQCVAVCCSVFHLRQCVAVCWSGVLQCVAVCCSVLQCVDTRNPSHLRQCVADISWVCCSVLQCVAVCCSVLQCVPSSAVCCSVLVRCVAVCCSVSQCVAVRRHTQPEPSSVPAPAQTNQRYTSTCTTPRGSATPPPQSARLESQSPNTDASSWNCQSG